MWRILLAFSLASMGSAVIGGLLVRSLPCRHRERMCVEPADAFDDYEVYPVSDEDRESDECEGAPAAMATPAIVSRPLAMVPAVVVDDDPTRSIDPRLLADEVDGMMRHALVHALLQLLAAEGGSSVQFATGSYGAFSRLINRARNPREPAPRGGVEL